ncbi:hypothetical protein TcCL_NonESM08725 [Trypanosoma cruzi]|nr:hypothetical protein TcCL_NonESM08725 [Trypanosoma cruzi]
MSTDDRLSFLLRQSVAAFFRGHEEGRGTGRGQYCGSPPFCVQRTARSTVALKCSTARYIDGARGERRFFSAVGVRDCASAAELALFARLCLFCRCAMAVTVEELFLLHFCALLLVTPAGVRVAPKQSCSRAHLSARWPQRVAVTLFSWEYAVTLLRACCFGVNVLVAV